MYKAVVTDLDGTLLNEKHDISEDTRETIKKLLDNGIKFYIATGRNYYGAKHIMDKLKFEIPLITSNVARIVDNKGNEIYVQNIEEEYKNLVLEIDFKKIDDKIVLNGYTGNDWYSTDDIREKLLQINPERPQVAEPITLEQFKEKSYSKIFFSGEHESLVKLEKKIIEKIGNKINIVFVSENSLELFSKKCDKAIAAEFLLKKDGLTLKDAVTFGDGYNDYELLKNAGKGYVMGNAIYRLVEVLPENEMIGTNAEESETKKLKEIFDI